MCIVILRERREKQAEILKKLWLDLSKSGGEMDRAKNLNIDRKKPTTATSTS